MLTATRATASRLSPLLFACRRESPLCVTRHRTFATLLSNVDLATALQDLSSKHPTLEQWQEDTDRNTISKSFTFRDFKQAWQFMSGVADKAEKMNHHPEWFNVYNIVDVTLTTHDCGGVSSKDIEMAEYMEEASAKLLPGNSAGASK